LGQIAKLMQWVVGIFAVVVMLIVDQAWYYGHYTALLARLLSRWIA